MALVDVSVFNHKLLWIPIPWTICDLKVMPKISLCTVTIDE